MSSHHSHSSDSSHIPEIIGFICRWCLLTLGGCVVIFAVWATVYAASTVHNEIQTNVVFPDRICVPATKRISLIGAAAPYLPPSGGTLTYHSDFDKKIWLGILSPPYRHIHHGLPSAASTPLPLGRQIVDIKGMPFSPMTFKHYPARLDVLMPGTRLSLIEADFAVRLAESQPGKLRSLLKALSTTTTPAFVSVGDINTYIAQKETLNAFCDLPVLSIASLSTPKPANVIWQLLSDMKLKQAPRNQRFVIITDKIKLANAWKTYGYVHLIGHNPHHKHITGRYYHDTTGKLLTWLTKDKLKIL